MFKESSSAVLPEQNENYSEAEEMIVSAYSEFIVNEQKTASEASRMYEDIFYGKKANENLIANKLLEKNADFLEITKNKLEGAVSDEERERIALEFTEKLRGREEIKNKLLEEFKNLAKDFNNRYKKIWNLNVLKELDKLRSTNDVKFEDTASLNEAVSKGYKPWWLIYEEQKDKYDSQRIEKLLAGYKELSSQEKNNEKYKGIVKQLEELLKCQNRLENKLDQIVAGSSHAETDNKLMERFNEIKDLTKKLADYIHSNLGEAVKQIDVEKIADKLFKEALVIISLPTSSEEEKNGAIKKLEKIKADVLRFKAVFKQVRKEHQEIRLAEFKDLDIQFDIKSADISMEDARKMRENIEKNYPDLEERKIALEGFEKGLKNKDTVFNVLRYKNEITSFLRFDRHYEKGVSYFGSFNTGSDFQKAAIGEAMMRECLEAEFAFNAEVMEAHAFPDKKITSKYIEEAGFIVEDIELDYLDTGKSLFKIKRDDSQNWRYSFREDKSDKSHDFIIDEAFRNPLPSYREPFALHVTPEKLTQSSFLQKLKDIMKKYNLVITRFFPDNKENPKNYFMALETRISEPESSAYIV